MNDTAPKLDYDILESDHNTERNIGEVSISISFFVVKYKGPALCPSSFSSLSLYAFTKARAVPDTP